MVLLNKDENENQMRKQMKQKMEKTKANGLLRSVKVCLTHETT